MYLEVKKDWEALIYWYLKFYWDLKKEIEISWWLINEKAFWLLFEPARKVIASL